MKISKTKLRQIIKEELGSLHETTQDAQVRLQSLANELGADENFVDLIRQSIAAAASTHATAEAQALGLVIEALETLLPAEELSDDDVEYADDSEALVLGKDGAPSPEKIAKQQRQLKYGFEDWRK